MISYPDKILISSTLRSRRSEHIAQHLRTLIISGQLKPGSRLPTENQLCQHFHVSRTTLREATQMLRSSGLLDVTPGRGSFIRLPEISPLLTDLALAARTSPYNTSSVAEACHLLPALLTPLLPGIAGRPQHLKHPLLHHIIQPQLAPDENTEVEEAWFKTLSELAQQGLSSILIQFLLTVTLPQRQQSFLQADTVSRQRQLQLRCTNALIDGDADIAIRTLQQYFVHLPGMAANTSPVATMGNGPSAFARSM